jgi:hypothetical protein
MALQPTTQSFAGKIEVFAKVTELYKGGFRLVVGNYNTGVILPEGSLLKVDEAARTATMLKSAVLMATGGGTQQVVKSGHHFKVGEFITLAGAGTAYSIKRVEPTGSNSLIAIGTAIPNGGTGAVLVEATGSGTGASAAVKTVANSLSRYPVEIGTTEGVAAVRKGTAYKRRVQAHGADQIAGITFIEWSNSY